MQQVKDDKKVNAQYVDSLQTTNHQMTCCKLSFGIKSASPQFNTHLFCQPDKTQTFTQFYPSGWFQNTKQGESR